jgi:hypothetical protein
LLLKAGAAALDLENKRDALTEQIEKAKAGIRAKVEHPFRVIKCQFGFIKVRYRGLAQPGSTELNFKCVPRGSTAQPLMREPDAIIDIRNK